MDIVVCIKQVPNTAQLRFDGQGNVSLDGVEQVLNPSCGYALEAAVRLKESRPEGSTTVTVFSLGGPGARDVLKRGIAMGCDAAVLLTDEAFKGLDAQGVAGVLKAAISHYVPNASLILFGQFTDDGMSGITGPAVAKLMNLPCVTLASKAECPDDATASLTRETEDSAETYSLKLPGVICYANSEHEPRIPSIKGVMRANRVEIPIVNATTIGWTAGEAVTKVLKTWRKPKKEGGVKVDGAEPQAAVDELVNYLQAQKVL